MSKLVLDCQNERTEKNFKLRHTNIYNNIKEAHTFPKTINYGSSDKRKKFKINQKQHISTLKNIKRLKEDSKSNHSVCVPVYDSVYLMQ